MQGSSRLWSCPCAFCGPTRERLSREHALPKWARETLKPLEPNRPYTVHSGEGTGPDSPKLLIRRLPHLNVVVRHSVCRRCNNEFLASLHRRAKPLLGAVIKSPLPMQLDRGGQALVAAWATKTVWLLELAAREMFSGERKIPGYKVSEPKAAYFCSKREPPPRTLVWLGSWNCRTRVPLMYERSMAELPTQDGARVTGHLTTFAVGYVALPVCTVNFVEAEAHRVVLWNTNVPQSLAESISRIWPVLTGAVSWPRRMFPYKEWTRLVSWDGRLGLGESQPGQP